MSYLKHKEHFEIAYKTGADIWTHPPTAEESVKLTENLKPGAFILDIGSGRGFFTRHLAKMGFNVIGLDFEEGIVKKANENIKDWGLEGKLKFIEGDALNIPLPDASFDAVCDIGLFETLYKEDWPKYANEVSRILKPGGFYLNVSLSRETPHFFEYYPKKDTKRDFEKYGIYYHFFEKEEMENIFADKFEIVSEQTELDKKEREIILLETLFQKIKK